MTATRSKLARSRRLAGVGAGVVLVALVTGARGPSTGSAEAFVKPPTDIPIESSILPDVIASAALDAIRPTTLVPGGEQPGAVSGVSWSDIPDAALQAYRRAEIIMQKSAPGCGLTWEILAGIGRVESDHGRFGGATVNADGTTTPRIYGVALNGVGNVAAISDSENGTLDGDSEWDRAVGPMQFLPTTWETVGVDADGDGVANPHDLDDAALAAGVYLCAGDVDLRDRSQLKEALWRYNPSAEYVALVLSYIDAYRQGEAPPNTAIDTPVDRVETLTEPPDEPASPVASQLNPPPANSTGPSDGPGGPKGPSGGPGPGTDPPPGTTPPKDEPPPTNPPKDEPPPTNPPKDEPPVSEPPPSEPPPSEPPPSEPPPSEPPPSEPPPSEPPPSEPPPPDLTTITGTLQQRDDGNWYLDDQVLDLGPDDYVQQGQASEDYDGDTTVEIVTPELEGLAGVEVTLEVEMTDTAAVVYTIQGLVYRPADGSPPPWETA